ncbi:MAG: CotH kinase family protein [Clostridia bacterium]|nr:CotH kinase family protein [Clostridia bacterium]
MKKKLLYISLMVLVFVFIFALSVGAATYDDTANGVKYTVGANQTVTVNNFLSGVTTVNIPSTVSIDGTEYKVVGFDKSNNKGTITVKVVTNLTISSEYITEIPASTFNGFTTLQKVRITSPIVTFGDSCFKGCTNINDIYVDFSSTTTVSGYAFFFTNNERNGYQSKAIWNYNGEPINLYNVTYIGRNAFFSSRIGGYNVTGGEPNTIIWPNCLNHMDTFAFSGANIGGTVYYNSKQQSNASANKQFSTNYNYIETFIIGPDTVTIANFNNGVDTGFNGTAKTVIVLSQNIALAKYNNAERTNIFDNWGEITIYCVAGTDGKTLAAMQKQSTGVSDNNTEVKPTIVEINDDYTFSYSAYCKLAFLGTVKEDGETVSYEKAYHYGLDKNGVADETMCPIGSVVNCVCATCGYSYTKYADGYDASNVKTHTFVDGLLYVNAITKFTVGNFCETCDLQEGEKEEYAPIIKFLGYSAKINGDKICVGYSINKESYDAYVNAGGSFTFGVLFAAPGDAGEFDLVNVDGSVTIDKAAAATVSMEYISCEFVIKDFDWQKGHCDEYVILCAYVNYGENVNYIGIKGDKVVESDTATSFTMNEMAYELSEKYTVNFNCDNTMGEIVGDSLQTVVEGETSTAVTAQSNDGYTFICWSDGSKNPTIQVTPEEDTTLFAYFSPASTGLPVMSINTENGVDILTKEYYINCEITLLDTQTGKSFANEIAEIKGRGNSTWEKFDKKPYKFKFDSKQNLFGLGKEKTWVLLADARDYSLLRNMLALDAGLTMSELDFTSQGQSVELYVNGEYRGVYYLCEQIQIKGNRVNVAEESEKNPDQNPNTLGYLVEMDGWIAEGLGKLNSPSTIPERGSVEGDIFFKVNDGLKYGYAVKDPEDVFYKADGTLDVDGAYLTYIQTYMQTCFDTIKNGTYEEVCALINVKSFAQAYIIYEWFKNPDTNYSSVYFYKDADVLNEDGTYTYSTLNCGPIWDFDMAIGNVSHKGNGVFSNTTTLWTAQNNPWFKNLLAHDEFKALVAEELLANESTLRASVASTIAYALEHKEAYLKNFEKWDVIGTNSWSVPTVIQNIETWEGNLEYIENYLDASLDYLIEYYSQYLPVSE